MSTATIEIPPKKLTADQLMEQFISAHCQDDELDVRNQLACTVRLNGCGPRLSRKRHIEMAVLETPGASVGRWQGEGVIGNQSGACLWEQDVTDAGIRYATFLVAQEAGKEVVRLERTKN